MGNSGKIYLWESTYSDNISIYDNFILFLASNFGLVSDKVKYYGELSLDDMKEIDKIEELFNKNMYKQSYGEKSIVEILFFGATYKTFVNTEQYCLCIS